jgi:hypothetical protein
MRSKQKAGTADVKMKDGQTKDEFLRTTSMKADPVILKAQ